jgi:hypothetical protein
MPPHPSVQTSRPAIRGMGVAHSLTYLYNRYRLFGSGPPRVLTAADTFGPESGKVELLISCPSLAAVSAAYFPATRLRSREFC